MLILNGVMSSQHISENILINQVFTVKTVRPSQNLLKTKTIQNLVVSKKEKVQMNC